MNDIIERLLDRSKVSLENELVKILNDAAVEIKYQRKRATDAEYFKQAYINMLGEKGLEVAKMWKAKGVTRVHFSWGPEAHKLTGEERAAFILEWEKAPRKIMNDID